MWTYKIDPLGDHSTGQMWHGDPEPAFLAYSGAEPDGKNNPAMESVEFVGPIPEGDYIIEGPPFDDPKHGVYCLRLMPAASNQMYGRAGFLLHGDSSEHPGCASEGCICASPIAYRQRVWNSGDRELIVVAR